MLTSFSIAIMVEAKMGHNLVNISLILLKSESRRLNSDPNPSVKYQNPSLSGSQDIVLTRFSLCYNGKVEKGARLNQYFTEFAQKLIRSSKH